MRAVKLLFRALASLALVMTVGSAHALLVSRDLDGDATNGPEAYYDTALDVTWLRAASTGSFRWSEAVAWAQQDRYGLSGWRLPTLRPVNGAAFNYDLSYNGTTDRGYGQTGSGWGTASEMGHLFYADLGVKGYCAPEGDPPPGCAFQTDFGLIYTRDFQNLSASTGYWTGLNYGGDPPSAWFFSTVYGYQAGAGVYSSLYAFAVRPGDVAASVPEPATHALWVGGLALLLGVRRRTAFRCIRRIQGMGRVLR